MSVKVKRQKRETW